MKKSISISNITKLYSSFSDKLYIYLRYIILPFYLIEKYIPKKGKIVDIGCGHGAFSIYLALKEKSREIIGLDFNKKRIESANKAASNLKNVKFYSKDFIKDPAITKTEAIILIDLLHHVPYNTQKDLLEDCFKKIKKGGELIIKDISDKPRWKYYHNYLHDKLLSGQTDLFFIQPKKVKNLLTEVGFRIKINSKKINVSIINPYPHYIIVAKK